jgi:iron complex transport system substrate-binding protein
VFKLISVLSFLAAAGCFFLTPSSAADPVVVENFDYSLRKNVLTFSSVPKKVIAMNGAVTEMMLRLGLAERLAGTAYLDNPVMPDLREAYERIPVLSARYPGREMVLHQEPDLIVGWRSAFAPQTLGDVHYWNKLGVNTFIARNTLPSYQKVSDFYDDIRDLGRIFNIEDRAGDYIRLTEDVIRTINERLPPVHERPLVLLAEFAQHGSFRAFAENSLAGDMLKLAGGRNAFPREGLYSLEALIQADPDVIIMTHMLQDHESVEDRLTQIKAHPILRKIKAVKNGRLYSMPLAEVYSPGVRIPDGLRRLSAYLHPGRFAYEPF